MKYKIIMIHVIHFVLCDTGRCGWATVKADTRGLEAFEVDGAQRLYMHCHFHGFLNLFFAFPAFSNRLRFTMSCFLGFTVSYILLFTASYVLCFTAFNVFAVSYGWHFRVSYALLFTVCYIWWYVSSAYRVVLYSMMIILDSLALSECCNYGKTLVC